MLLRFDCHCFVGFQVSCCPYHVFVWCCRHRQRHCHCSYLRLIWLTVNHSTIGARSAARKNIARHPQCHLHVRLRSTALPSLPFRHHSTLSTFSLLFSRCLPSVFSVSLLPAFCLSPTAFGIEPHFFLSSNAGEFARLVIAFSLCLELFTCGGDKQLCAVQACVSPRVSRCQRLSG